MDRREFLKAMGATGVAMITSPAMSASETKPGSEPWRTRVTDHFDGEEFFNPGLNDEKGIGDLLKWRFNRTPGPWPESRDDNHPFTFLPVDASSSLRATRINHCTFLVQLGSLNLLTDPIYSQRTSPVSWAGPKRLRKPGIAWEDLPTIDVVLVSHNHFDHLDLPTLRRLHKRFAPTFITGLGNRAFLAEEGIPGAIELDWWEQVPLGPETRLTYTPAQHWSNRGGGTRNKTLWGGFYLHHKDVSVYFAGDTGYCTWFSEIQKKLGAPTLAMLPIGAYKPRWFMRTNHMNPEEAAQAHLDLGAKWSLPMHHDTFRLADEGYDEPLNDLRDSLAAKTIPPEKFPFTAPGETWSVKQG
ncbi:MAG: MBL fold metallo-hydrolase [Opitutaceae bacterium]|nr:MBL fold metallo-hydrolase [Opitutaceae bacterium]